MFVKSVFTLKALLFIVIDLFEADIATGVTDVPDLWIEWYLCHWHHTMKVLARWFRLLNRFGSTSLPLPVSLSRFKRCPWFWFFFHLFLLWSFLHWWHCLFQIAKSRTNTPLFGPLLVWIVAGWLRNWSGHLFLRLWHLYARGHYGSWDLHSREGEDCSL